MNFYRRIACAPFRDPSQKPYIFRAGNEERRLDYVPGRGTQLSFR